MPPDPPSCSRWRSGLAGSDTAPAGRPHTPHLRAGPKSLDLSQINVEIGGQVAAKLVPRKRHIAVSRFCPSLFALRSTDPVILNAAARSDGDTPRFDELKWTPCAGSLTSVC